MAAVMSSFHMHFAATPLRWGHAVAAISKEPRVCKGSQAIQASPRQEYVHIMDLLCLNFVCLINMLPVAAKPHPPPVHLREAPGS
jgi:hypothetical protein